ncbi:GGDEF domain-containing protein [Gammaproteobacteria bacterium AS21]
MKINWSQSISTRINAGMLGILISLFAIATISFWMTSQFNSLSSEVSEKHLQELSKSAELHLLVKNIHRKMDALIHETNKVGNRIIVQELISDIKQVSSGVMQMSEDSYTQSMILMINELLPIVNSYSLEVDQYLLMKKQLLQKIAMLDTLYFTALDEQKFRVYSYNDKLNRLYTLTRSLPDQTTTFKFRKTAKEIQKLISDLNKQYYDSDALFELIYNADDSIVKTIQSLYKIKLNLSVLNTQTDVIIEQLNSVSLEKMTVLNDSVKISTNNLYQISNKFITLIMTIVLLTTFFTIILMFAFNRRISKRLMLIANSIGVKENKENLSEQISDGSEISVIAKAILKYIDRSEQQTNEIKAHVKQLMLVVENSSQVVIIYSDDKIVYSNEYCDQLLDLNDHSKTDIVSQNLLVAINNSQYEDRLKVGELFFRFFATQIEWNGKKSTLALMTDITAQVKKESQLMRTLEIVKDESLTDTLTGLYNRRKLELVIDQNLYKNYALIVADIDWFKAFNDHYGHSQGDICISKVAIAIKENLRNEGDLAVRYGGEEFVILLFNSNMEQAKMVAQRIQETIQKLQIKHEKSIFKYLSLSFGVAHSSEVIDMIWDDLFDTADKRLYRAKAYGRARIVANEG